MYFGTRAITGNTELGLLDVRIEEMSIFRSKTRVYFKCSYTLLCNAYCVTVISNWLLTEQTHVTRTCYQLSCYFTLTACVFLYLVKNKAVYSHKQHAFFSTLLTIKQFIHIHSMRFNSSVKLTVNKTLTTWFNCLLKEKFSINVFVEPFANLLHRVIIIETQRRLFDPFSSLTLKIIVVW